MAAKIYRINYKSDFILTLTSDAGWTTPFCIKFWTGAPAMAYYAGWDGETYAHCAYDPAEPTKLQVQFDDHHLPVGDLKFQIGYHFTVADFPNDTEDEVINPANITVEINSETYQVMLDFTGETAPEIEFALPAYSNEQQRIANEQQREQEFAQMQQDFSQMQQESGEATEGAENVNAQLNGTILTVTNREGVSTSSNVQGPQGEKGDTGATGPQGPQGSQGPAATITVGTTTTGAPGTPAEVTNSGTSGAAVLDFIIPQGAKGDKGDKGDTGEVTEEELTEKLAAKANTDGYYSRMIVGGAESLIGDVPQTATYTFRRTGGGAIGEPVARLTEIQGNTGVVNQLVDTNTTEVATISGHKYCTVIGGTKSIVTSTGSAIAVTGGTDQVFDLTLMYGSGNEPGTVAEFEARIWRDYGKTLDEYIAYTQGKLVNCKAVALENVGQNQWDEEWETGGLDLNTGATTVRNDSIRSKNYISVIPLQTYYAKNATVNLHIVEYDANKNYIGSVTHRGNTTFAISSDCAYIKFYSIIGDVYNHDICINISDAAINGTYRPYWKEVTNLNLTTLTGINPNTGVRERFAPNGLGGGDGWRSALRVVNGATVAVVNSGRTNSQELKTFAVSSTAANSNNIIRFVMTALPKAQTYNIKCNLLKVNTTLVGLNDATEEAISGYNAGNGLYFYLNTSRLTGDLSTASARQTAFRNWLNSNDLEIEYELAAPIVYTDLQYADGTPFVLPKNFEVQNDGTERITHAEGEDSVAPVMSAIYGLNAVGFVQDAPKDYTSQATLDGLIAKISAITGTTITKTWDAANNKWTFS